MVRFALLLLFAAFALEYGRGLVLDLADTEIMTVRVDGVDQHCVLQRKLTGGTLQSAPMNCSVAQARAAQNSGVFGEEVAYVLVLHFTFRSPVDRRIYTGAHRTKAARSPPPVGPTLEIRASKLSAGRYRVVN